MVIMVLECTDGMMKVRLRRDRALGFVANEEQIVKTWSEYLVTIGEGAQYWANIEERYNG